MKLSSLFALLVSSTSLLAWRTLPRWFALLIFLFVLQKFLDQDVKLFPQSFDCVLSVLSELFAVLDLRLQELTELLVVVFQLLALQSLLQDVLPVAVLRRHSCVGEVLIIAVAQNLALGVWVVAREGLRRPNLSHDQVSQVLEVFNVLKQCLIVLLQHMLRLLLAAEDVLDMTKRQVYKHRSVMVLHVNLLDSFIRTATSVSGWQFLRSSEVLIGTRANTWN